MIELEVGTRLHFALIDVGFATPRVFGGSGLALQTPSARIGWKASAESNLTVQVGEHVDARAHTAISAALSSLQGIVGPIAGRLMVMDAPPQHVGLGVTTALVLGALHLLNNVEGMGLAPDAILKLSGRGRTSGVGTGTFFEGGFVVDAGRARSGMQELLPSGASTGTGISLKTSRLSLPDDWVVRLCLPDGRRWSGDDEVDFFRRNSPIPEDEALATLALTYHGVVPSILEADVGALKRALAALNRTGFKDREVASHGNEVRALLDQLESSCDAAVGMSSMGPLVLSTPGKKWTDPTV